MDSVFGICKIYLIAYEAQLPATGARWQGFRGLRDDHSARIDRRLALSYDPRQRSAIVSGPGLRIARNQEDISMRNVFVDK